MIKFTNERGEQLLALAELTYKATVNGEKSLSGTIYTNDEVLNKIDRGWYVEFDNENYVITYAKPSDLGENITVEFEAVHEFFYKMGKSAVYSQLSDGSHTADEYLHFIFDGSEYYFQLGSPVAAFEKQSFGLKNRMALFNDFIDSTSLEFYLSGHTVTIIDKVGSDLSTIVRKGFNLQELTLERNISDFVTYAKGFGAYLDENNHDAGRIAAEYTSPLADIYGKLEADPVSDERYTVVENLQARLREVVDGSYTISVGMTLEDLQEAGYEYSLPTPGDYIMGVDEELGFSQKVRIVSTETDFDVTGNKQGTKVTLNSISSVDSKIQSDASTSHTMSNIINGNGSIPNSWLEDATQIATEALQDTQTELKFTSNGILAIDKTNANNVVILNSAGIGVSTDGGKTFANAMTGNGINATAITTGTLNAVLVKIMGKSTQLDMSGEGLVIRPTASNQHWETSFGPTGINFKMQVGDSSEDIGGLISLAGGAGNVNGVYLGLHKWNTPGQGFAGDEIGFAYTNGTDSNGNATYWAPFIYNATGVGKERGFHFKDRIMPDGAVSGMEFGWVSWSDWTGKVPALMSEGHQGGIAFPSDGNVILFGQGKRWDISSRG